MAAAPILALQDIRLTIGSTPVLEGAELSVTPGDKIALVGRNGSGKSTLLKIAAGEIEADSGRRFLQPGVTIRYLPQEPDLSGFATTLGYVEDGMEAGDDHYRGTYLLNALGLKGDEDPARLSGGEARRAELSAAPGKSALSQAKRAIRHPWRTATRGWIDSYRKTARQVAAFSSGSRPPRPSSATRSSQPPTWVSPMKICGTVRRPVISIIFWRSPGSRSTRISLSSVTPRSVSNCLA